jgi:hypothetical protein
MDADDPLLRPIIMVHNNANQLRRRKNHNLIKEKQALIYLNRSFTLIDMPLT